MRTAALLTVLVALLAVGLGGALWLARLLARRRARSRRQAAAALAAPPSVLPDEPGPWPYRVRQLVSPAQLGFYQRLCAALPDHMVLVHVPVTRVLGVRRGFDAHAWYQRIHRLSYDFVVCNRDGWVLAAVELEDVRPADPQRDETARRKERATAAAGVPLLRWPMQALPERAAIQARFAGLRPRRPETEH